MICLEKCQIINEHKCCIDCIRNEICDISCNTVERFSRQEIKDSCTNAIKVEDEE